MHATDAPPHRHASGQLHASYAAPALVSYARTPGGRATVRVLIASHQPIIRHGLH